MWKTSLTLAASLVVLSHATGQIQIPKTNLWAHYSAVNGINGKATAQPDKTPITFWNDISGNKRHLTRKNTAGPVIAKNDDTCGMTAVFCRDGYVFANPGDAGWTKPLTGEKTIFMIAKANTPSVRSYLFDGRPSGQPGRTALFAGQNSCRTDWTVYVGGEGTIGCGQNSPIKYDRYLVHTVTIKAGAQEHYINGTRVAKGTFKTAGSLDGLIIGARVNGVLRLNGYVVMMAIYDKVLSTGLRIATEKLLLSATPLGYGESYGTACADSKNNVPALSMTGCARSPGKIGFALAKGTPSSVGVLLFGIGKSNIPFGAAARQCSIVSSPPWFFVVPIPTDSNGAFSSPAIQIPASNVGVKFTTQTAILDQALADKWSFTNGLEVVIDK